MANIVSKTRLYLEENNKVWETERKNIVFRNDLDVKGDYIDIWNVSGLSKPTKENLATYESAATTFETNDDVRVTRRTAYGDIGDQLDLLYKDIVAGKLDTTGEWAKKIKAVKDANVKEAD